MSNDEMRHLDGPTLAALALTLGLAPAGTEPWEGLLYDWSAREGWEPWQVLRQADACFRALRALGWTTGVMWFGDDRQYGEAWAARQGSAVGVKWPTEVATECLALLRCAVLALANQRDTRPPHADGSPCHCVPGTAGMLQHHPPPSEAADAAEALSRALGLAEPDHMGCGHPLSAVSTGSENTSYCTDCEAAARGEG